MIKISGSFTPGLIAFAKGNLFPNINLDSKYNTVTKEMHNSMTISCFQ